MLSLMVAMIKTTFMFYEHKYTRCMYTYIHMYGYKMCHL